MDSRPFTLSFYILYFIFRPVQGSRHTYPNHASGQGSSQVPALCQCIFFRLIGTNDAAVS